MDKIEQERRIRVREVLEASYKSSIEQRIDRYLEINHQGIIAYHHFTDASSECISLYRDGYFISTVMMSHAINEGIIKFVAERNGIKKDEDSGLIEELLNKKIISPECAEASNKIWKSYRNDIHHMNFKVAEVPFPILAKQNILALAIIEREIFGFDTKDGKLILHQPKYWDLENNATPAYLRLE